MSELKPCPKCGGAVQVVKSSDPPLRRPERNGCHIQCNACDLLYGYDTDYAGIYSTEAEAIATWNRTPPAHKYTLEELRGMDGQPVYIASLNATEGCVRTGSWKICYGVDPSFTHGYVEKVNLNSGIFMNVNDYNKTWAAYDREPEEEQ